MKTEYELDGNKIQVTGEERDLGVFVTNDLKPSVQCAKAAAKGMQVLGVIKRNFVLTDEEDFRLLFNGLAAGGANAPAYWAPASLIRPTPKKTPVA